MRSLSLILLFSAAAHAQPAITNLRAAQRPGTNLVDLDYDISGTTKPARISLEFSQDSGTTFLPATSVTGSVGDSISPATNLRLTWDAGKDLGGISSPSMRYRITADDNPPPKGMSRIPAGAFQMGDALDGISDAPVHTVTLSEYLIGQKEVTKAEWDEVRDWGLANGYTDLAAGSGKAANHPVHSIDWFNMVKWCNARSEKEGLTPCYTVSGAVMKGSGAPDCNWTASGYRLPTEAEWEKAARGGLSGKRFPWGDTISQSQANYYASTSSSYDLSGSENNYHPTYATGGMPYTSPVGGFTANGYGLYDMAGNVLEWCWDWHGTYASGEQTDPRGATSGSVRVFRGGSWFNNAVNCRAAYRYGSAPASSDFGIGFRVARSSVP